MKKDYLRGLLLGTILLVAQVASAEVLIHQVLYDPVQESGSEAVELVNTGNAIVDISGWQIESDQFSPDATLTNGSRIEPAGFFLITDKNWSKQKDSKNWPDADYEETMSLKNSVGGIALKNSQNQVVDRVGWGDLNKFVKASAVQDVKQGQSIIRVKVSNNNSADFSAITPVFADKQNSVMLLEVTLAQITIFNAFLLADDDNRSGTQIMPFTANTRELVVRAIVQGTPVLEFLNTSIAMNLLSNNTFEAILQLPYFTSPGNVSAFIRVRNQSHTLNFEVLANKAWRVEPRKIMRSAIQGETIMQEFMILNQGNIGVNLRVSDVVLQSNNTLITGKVDVSTLQLLAAQQTIIHASISVPEEAIGMFSGVLDVQEVER